VTDLVCASCGLHQPPSANFCPACGAPLIGPVVDPTVVLHAGDHHGDGTGDLTEGTPGGETAALLVVRGGPDAGQVFELEQTVTTLGRATDNDIFLDDVTVSRRHAVIVSGPGGFAVRDAGSLNGTYRNRVRIAQADLEPGDELQIGRFRLLFLRRGDASPDA
jgi:hypothetical protein